MLFRSGAVGAVALPGAVCAGGVVVVLVPLPGRVTTDAFLSGRYNGPFMPQPAATTLAPTIRIQLACFIDT